MTESLAAQKRNRKEAPPGRCAARRFAGAARWFRRLLDPQDAAPFTLERVVTASKDKNKYTKQNTDLACYICNNAKSDFISPKNFKSIAYGINDFWKEQNIDATFPHKSDIWNK